MIRGFLIAILIACVAGFAAPGAFAGVPRGLVLSADEQDADDTTGITIARGNAEVAIAAYAILGHADVIELRPQLNEILFKGRAVLTVGHKYYENETVTCTLDFSRCTASAEGQTLPSPDAAAVISPR